MASSGLNRPAHPALVSEAGFIAAQDVIAARSPAPRAALAAPGNRRYLLAGLLTLARLPPCQEKAGYGVLPCPRASAPKYQCVLSGEFAVGGRS